MRERKRYVLMFTENGRAMFATATVKRSAIRHAKRLHATVYAIPWPGIGWDCPTIRAVFEPIFQG